jgi:hypothetical protein
MKEMGAEESASRSSHFVPGESASSTHCPLGNGRERQARHFPVPPTICEEIKVEKGGTVININIKN